jgi:hypothetical protein
MRRASCAALGLIMLAACGTVPQKPLGALSPAVSSTPGLIAFAGPCRLAVTWGGDGKLALGGGFLSFPGALFTADPNAHGVTPVGQLGITFSTKTKLWLPGFPTPDGSKYVYAWFAKGIEMRVFEMGTGQDIRLDDGDKMWTPFGVDDSAAYAMSDDLNSLWRFPLTGAPRTEVSAAGGYWRAVSAGAAWGFATASLPDGVPTVLRRLDLGTGSVKDFARFSVPVTIVGFDGAGLPVLASNEGGTVYLLNGSGTATQIAFDISIPKGPTGWTPPYIASGDQNGLWLGAPSGVYLYRNGALGKVTNIAATPSGGCV